MSTVASTRAVAAAHALRIREHRADAVRQLCQTVDLVLVQLLGQLPQQPERDARLIEFRALDRESPPLGGIREIRRETEGVGFNALYENFLETQVASVALKVRF